MSTNILCAVRLARPSNSHNFMSITAKHSFFVSELVRLLDLRPEATSLTDVELRLLYVVINFHTRPIKDETPTEKRENG